MSRVGKIIFDIFYPIGTYYETSNTDFNPNTARSWYGTWVEDTEGQVLASRGTGDFATVGANIGSTGTTTNTFGDGRRNADNGNDWACQGLKMGLTISTVQPTKIGIRWHRIA